LAQDRVFSGKISLTIVSKSLLSWGWTAYHTLGAPSCRILIADKSKSYICQLKNVFQAPINKNDVLSPLSSSFTACENIDCSCSNYQGPEVLSMRETSTLAQ